jgi:hypothetical protein
MPPLGDLGSATTGPFFVPALEQDRGLPYSRHMGDTSKPRDTRSSFYFATDADRSRAIRASIGSRIREMYSHLLQEPLPPKIADLLGRLELTDIGERWNAGHPPTEVSHGTDRRAR